MMGKAVVPPAVTLAFWRVRRTWGMLLATGVGIIAAVLLVCVVPLYTQITMTGGLRGSLTAAPQNADVTAQAFSERVYTSVINDTTTKLDQKFHSRLGPYLAPPHFSMETIPTFIFDKNVPPINQTYFVTEPMEQARHHLSLLQGRLPSSNIDTTTISPQAGADIEIALTQEEASLFNLHLGSVISTAETYKYLSIKSIDVPLRLHIVGIFTPAAQDGFWHQHDFQHVIRGLQIKGEIITVLTSNESLLSVLNKLTQSPELDGYTLKGPIDLFWLYRFAPERVSIDDLDAMLNGVKSIQLDIFNDTTLDQEPLIEHTGAGLPTSTLQDYQSRVPVARVSILAILALVVALLLFFVSMTADLLVDSQAASIALLRSRGTSRSQVFGAFVTQGVLMGFVALVMGPLLALGLVYLLAQGVLPPEQQSALNLITSNPLRVLLDMGWLALATTGAAIVTMTLSILRATRLNVVSLGREQARATHRPFWRRLNLDIMAIIIMALGYGFSLYLTASDALDTRTHLLLQSPLTLLGTVCLLMAAILLFMRFFPRLLNLGARLAARNRGAEPILAIAQMARAPRQAIRMTVLLALATAFAIFSLVFFSSESQRILDVAAFQSGADFSGVTAITGVNDDLQRQTTDYGHIRGVQAVSLGFAGSARGGQHAGAPIEVRAVDARTFASAATWSAQDSSQSLDELMNLLSSQRSSALAHNIVPAIVDTATADALHLSLNTTFALTYSNIKTTFVVVAEVHYIPTVTPGGTSQSAATNTATPVGGVLIDYQTYFAVYQKVAAGANNIPLNYVWLRTRDDATSLAHVRAVLNKDVNLQVSPFYDRRAIQDGFNQEGLSLALLGALAIGAALALLLALLGDILASWLSARGRLSNFAVMRALGLSRRQVAGVLLWEQSIVYTSAILLGILGGILLSTLVVPDLVFTGVPTTTQVANTTGRAFYASQSVPPIEVTASPLLVLTLAVLVSICVLALGLMVRVVSRPSISQALRSYYIDSAWESRGNMRRAQRYAPEAATTSTPTRAGTGVLEREPAPAAAEPIDPSFVSAYGAHRTARGVPPPPPARRKTRLALLLSALALIVIVVVGSITGLGNAVVTRFSRPPATPLPALAPGDGLFYIMVSPNWGHITVDGRPLAQFPTLFSPSPLRLSRGLHKITWVADPFQPQTCTVSVPSLLGNEPCTLESEATTPTGVQMRLVTFMASLASLPANQSSTLTEQIQATLDRAGSTDALLPGEQYVYAQSSTQAGSIVTATQPLRATLHIRLDTDLNSNSQCNAFSFNNCSLNGQNCHLLCTPTPVDLASNQPQHSLPTLPAPGSPTASPWLTYGVAYSTLDYKALNGRTVARNQPDTSNINDAMTDHLLSIGITWDGSAWHVSVSLAALDTFSSTAGNSALDFGCATASQEVNNALYYTGVSSLSVTQNHIPVSWEFAAGANRAAGCLGIVRPTTGPQAPPAYFLYRFGVLLAVNDLAHSYFPAIPLADAYEQNLALQIAAHPRKD
ncbi:MAG: FtsX-like permease family protein [Chloroflexota bacterium]|nr:FtsX-like permease family protein [Chloroflexota bacterium]